MGDNIWIGISRIASIVFTVIMFIFGIVLGVIVGEDVEIIGFLTFLGMSIGSFVIIAPIMVFLDIAEDISIIRHYHFIESNTDNAAKSTENKNIELLKKGGWRCSNCDCVNASYVGVCGCGTPRP